VYATVTAYERSGLLEKGDVEETKRVYYETNKGLLCITAVVTVLHSLFEVMAYTNEIEFWRGKDHYVGVSTKSVILELVGQIIIFLYLKNSDASLLILIFSFIGVVVNLYKISKVFDFFSFGKQKGRNEANQDEMTKTKEYDNIALFWVGVICGPIFVLYTLYMILTNEINDIYSFVISILAGLVYTFGFVQMMPQLFINYKMKSVANMPWKVFLYKFLNTIVDDLFSFVVKMPTLHRISCFRDDLIFVAYLYQRKIYPVDDMRMDALRWEDADKTKID
ncbi:transmembrane protein, partial [Entamoeba invadens IP1]